MPLATVTTPTRTRWSERLAAALGAPDAAVFFVFNGSGANVLSLRAALKPWEAAIVSANAHLQTDEVGAPEAVAGVKLLVAETEDGMMTFDGVRRLVERPNDEHAVKPGLLSLTQSTELGTIYSLDELRALVGAGARSWPARACRRSALCQRGCRARRLAARARVRLRRRPALVWRHQERADARRGGRRLRPGAGAGHAAPAQADAAAGVEDALHRGPVRCPARRRSLARERHSRQRHGAPAL